MDDVAAAARVSKGTLYNYFASKHDLFLAMVIESFDAGYRTVAENPIDASEPDRRLDQILDALAALPERSRLRVPVQYQAWAMIADDSIYQERLYGYLRAFFGARTTQIADTIREGQALGTFRPDADPNVFAVGIMAMLSGFFFRSTFDPGTTTALNLRAALDAMVRQSLLPPLPAPPSPRDATDTAGSP